jgi:DedD protein
MPLPAFLKRQPKPDISAASAAVPGDAIAQARTRARRRLVGAAVLLVIGVIAFPLLFETQPRPIPVDLPIEIPRKESVAPLPPPPATPAHAPRSVAVPPPASETASAAVSAVPLAAAPDSASTPPVPKPAPLASAPAPDDGSRAKAILEAKPTESKAAAEPRGGRYVVQIGAFLEAAAVRETRAKAEKLGFKTYTQEVDTSTGRRTRVRIGPFDSREEAAKVLDKLKAASLAGVVLTL